MPASLLKRSFDFFLFSSLYIAGCAVLMAYQTGHLLRLDYDVKLYLLFVFFSTICSYNFHWYLTPASATEMIRIQWTQNHRSLHLALFLASLIGSAATAFYFLSHWVWLCGAVMLTFLYSAPKLPLRPFMLLRKIAVGKTIFLAFVWTYVTTLLPVALSGKDWHFAALFFCISRFFLIYSICVVFDYRDRENDREEGIRSMITYFDERGVDQVFYLSIILFLLSTCALAFAGFTVLTIVLLLAPGLIMLALYKRAKTKSSDYFYYFFLDGLMMFSALFTSFLSI